jgi:beta-galactosidase
MQQMMPKNEDGKMEAAGFELGPEMMQMMGGFTIVRLSGMMGMMNIEVSKEMLLGLNAQLNKIKKPC